MQLNKPKRVSKIYPSLSKSILVFILALMPMTQSSGLFASTQNAPLSQTESGISPELLSLAQTGVGAVTTRIKPERTITTASELLDNGLLEADNALEESISEEEPAVEETATENAITEETATEGTVSEETQAVAGETASDTNESAVADETIADNLTNEPVESVDGTPINIDEIDVESYNAEGISIYAPAQWDVTTNSIDSIFQIAIPEEFFFGFVQSFDNNDFPGALAVVIMQNQAEAFVKQIDESAELLGVEVFTTDQRLPVVKISLATQIEGIDATGAFYVVAPGEGAYMFIALTSSDNWPIISPGVDLIAESMFFNGDLISVIAAEGGELAYTDVAETLTVAVPEDWQVSETGDADLPILLIDPTYQFATSLGVPSQFAADVDVNELVGLAKEGQADELTNLVISGLDLTADDFVLDEQQTDTFTFETGFAIRLVGTIDLGDGVLMPTMIHFGVLNENLIGAVTFGEAETTLTQEEEILAIINSVTVAE